jgi:hypothetical protein
LYGRLKTGACSAYPCVPLEWAARFGRQPRDLFDGCTNIAIATSMYSVRIPAIVNAAIVPS